MVSRRDKGDFKFDGQGRFQDPGYLAADSLRACSASYKGCKMWFVVECIFSLNPVKILGINDGRSFAGKNLRCI
jgi:hypothetical protein